MIELYLSMAVLMSMSSMLIFIVRLIVSFIPSSFINLGLLGTAYHPILNIALIKCYCFTRNLPQQSPTVY